MKKIKRLKFIIFTISLGFMLGFFATLRLTFHQLVTKIQAVTGTLNVSSTSQSASGDITGQKFVDVGSSSYFIDPNATGNSLIMAGSVGIKTTSPVTELNVNGRAAFGNNISGDAPEIAIQSDYIYSGNAGYRGFRQYLTQSAGGNVNPIIAIDGACYYTAASGTLEGCRGADYSVLLNSSGTITNAKAISTNLGTDITTNNGTITNAYLGDFENYAFAHSSGTVNITNAYGVRAGVKKNAGGTTTISTGYGLYISNVDATTNYGLYQADTTADNYFAGNVGIGTTAPGTKLEVAGQVKITGGSPGSGKVLTSDANGLATWETASSSYRTLVTLGSDVGSTASTAFQDATGLSFSVTSGTKYRFKATIIYTASAATIGSRWSTNGPASPTLLSTVAQWATAATTVSTTNATAYNTGTASTTSFSTAGNVATIEGLIIPSATGTFILRFAPETATANGIVVKAGSTLEYW